MCGGAVGGIAREDIPQGVARILADREQDLELWSRPERVVFGYTIEWTTLDYDRAESEWRGRTNAETDPDQ